MTIDERATEIYTEYESPADTPQATISAWLKANIGLLNTKLNLKVEVDGDSFSPDLDSKEWSIYKLIFNLYYLGNLIKRNLGASAYDWSELTEADSTVRRVSKNEIAKTYRTMQKSAEDDLFKMVHQYRFDKSLPISLEAINDLREYQRIVS